MLGGISREVVAEDELNWLEIALKVPDSVVKTPELGLDKELIVIRSIDIIGVLAVFDSDPDKSVPLETAGGEGEEVVWEFVGDSVGVSLAKELFGREEENGFEKL